MVEVSQPLAVIQPKELSKGTPEYEKKRSAILAAFAEEVPRELRLARDFIDNPPLNVTDIPRTCGILTAKEIDITENHDATAIAELIATKQLTAVEVAKAFSKRAIIAHQLTCCLTQWFMEDAIRHAQGLDDYLEKHGKTIGPLHGVPISVKEHMPIAQTYTSEGCFSSTVLNEHDSHMVSIFRSLGAVFYCKTNQPQGIMHLESTSHYGRTLNPFNIHLSAGGSSGGESALQSMKGSVLGIGTDIGGSIRAPSAFCGIYGFKATSDTLPMKDFLSHSTGSELNIMPSTGPMCRSLRDMDLFTKSLIDAKPWLVDPRLIPQKWTGLHTELPTPLKIGIIENDGFIIPQPPVRRAVKWLKERLSDPKLSSTIQVKAFKPYDAAGAWSKIRRMYWPEAALPLKDAIESVGEPMHPLTEWITADAKPHGMLDAEGVTHMRYQRDQFRLAFAESWREQDVDVVIGPAFVGPAAAHDTAFYWTYTSLYNFVDYPGAVFPTPIIANANDAYEASYQPLSKECAHVRQLWEASSFEGAPIALQIVGRRYHDNELFGALELLKGVLDLP